MDKSKFNPRINQLSNSESLSSIMGDISPSGSQYSSGTSGDAGFVNKDSD